MSKLYGINRLEIWAEKNIGKYLSIRPIIGYLQKGYLDDISMNSGDVDDYIVKDLKVIGFSRPTSGLLDLANMLLHSLQSCLPRAIMWRPF